MSEHIVPRKIYFLIFAALVVLTVATYLASLVNFGSDAINTVVALTIAVTKATLVVLYFMHVRYSSRLTWVVISSGVLWLMIMIGLTLSDYLTRNLSALPGGR